RQAIEKTALDRTVVLHDVFEQFLIVDLPVERPSHSPADGAAARAGFAADGDGHSGGQETPRPLRLLLTPIAVVRRLHRHQNRFDAIVHGWPLIAVVLPLAA